MIIRNHNGHPPITMAYRISSNLGSFGDSRVLGKLLELLVERSDITVVELRECGLLTPNETVAPEPKT